ncbi:HYR domain-containing protein [Ancylomarina euxinus]|uniref:HYR domain-containing protein n=1 Tax=Ancylomarina euxinus TaxID=2283627 RepID=A0A425Y572_9BACT|nr:PA14 domain-containing protein [Ancylomarina euxinus]MCZ4694442.1 PA14 domain-containing protein [Ancylomarina euxinus]MUP16659.1 HYR domain-containing protein [Ancylomarina euxinus]RRG23550.1 HYR domain-containing protein [Ancylomarina euxinus]
MNLRRLLLIVLLIFQTILLYGQTLTVPTPEQVCFGEQGSIQATMSSGPGNNRRYRFDLYLNSSRVDRITTGSRTVTFSNLQVGTYSISVYRVNNGGNNPSFVDSENNIVLNNETESPIFQNPQSDISVNASDNICGAIVSYVYPVASDNCSARTGAITGYTSLGTLNGHTYYYSNSAVNVTTASNNSTNLGGHLVTINTQAENDWINSKVGEVWIGYNDAVSEGNFVWVTGENSSYENWNGGEPNNSGGEDYTVMYANGSWNDLRGTNNRRYVVEFQTATLSQTAGLPSGSLFPIGTTTNTFLATDNSGNTSTHSFDVIVTDNTAPAIASLKAEYYNGRSFNTLMETLNVSELNYNWGSGAPESNLVGTDDFSIRFQGNVKAPQTGTYTFYTTSDDGVRLWVDNNLIINNWTDHGPTVNTGTFNLLAGEATPIQLEYYERGGGAVIKLEWSGPGLTREFLTDSGGGSCNDITLDLSATGSAIISADDIDPGYTDACGIASRVLSKTNFTCSDFGDNAVTLTVTDVNSNVSSCDVNVKVIGAPDNSLSVVGDTKCDNEDAIVIIRDSELGVSYALYLGVTQIGSSVNGTGSDLNIAVLAADLPVGNNSITVKASKGACELDLLNHAMIVINPKPSPVGIFHE